MVKPIDGKLFRELVRGGGKAVALFSMAGCGPCKLMKARLSGMNIGMPLVYLDAKDQETFAAFGVRTVPYLAAFENGKMKAKLIGNHSLGSVLSWVEETFEMEVPA